MRKKEFLEYLQEEGYTNTRTLRNYCSWVKRTEDKLDVELQSVDLIDETSIQEILEQLRVLPEYSRHGLLADTGTALRHYSDFLSTQDSAANDIKDLLKNSKGKLSTTTKQLIDARVGQGVFRNRVIKFWNGRCAVTGCSEIGAMTASHVKPWKNSTDIQRLDGENGLLLIPNLDKLFDKGFISFSNDGRIIISGRLSRKSQTALGVNGAMCLSKSSKKLKIFLASHRKKHKF